MRMASQRGFTLIEILVVITILGLLMAVILPNVLGASVRANQHMDRVNLTQIFGFMQEYKAKYAGKMPGSGGHKFLLLPWTENVISKTEKNRDHYFNPSLRPADPYYEELAKQEVATIWKRKEDLSSQDTHYAGRSEKTKMTMGNAGEPWAANDNENGRSWDDGTIHVLMSDGTVKVLDRNALAEFGWQADDNEFVYPVGPDSPHPLLQKLER